MRLLTALYFLLLECFKNFFKGRRLPLEVHVFWAPPTGKRLRGRPRICLKLFPSHLVKECFGIPQKEHVAGERHVLNTLLSLSRRK